MNTIGSAGIRIVQIVQPAAVVIDAVGAEKYTAAGTSASYSNLTVGSGVNRALVLCVIFGYSTTAPTGVTATWDSGGTNQSMSVITSIDNAGVSASTYLFGLVAPTSGNKTLALSWTNSAETFMAAVSFTGVNQTGGAVSFPNATTVANSTLTITSATGNYVMGGGAYGAAASEPISGTPLFNDHTNGTFLNAAAM